VFSVDRSTFLIACANSAIACRDTDGAATSSICVQEDNRFLSRERKIPMNTVHVVCRAMPPLKMKFLS
jgi:hypothetical protein